MRGTGSKDVVLENTFIPEHYAVPMIEAQMGTVPGVDIPLYRLPIRPALATMLLGTIVGMADRGLQLFIDKTRGRRDVYTGAMKSDNAGVQRRVAEASVEISCAWALTQQNCDLLEDAMLHDPPMPAGKRAQVRWNAAYATELCRRACNRLFEGAGAGAALLHADLLPRHEHGFAPRDAGFRRERRDPGQESAGRETRRRVGLKTVMAPVARSNQGV
jgi:alkylation response protein AidB-like acyl-CoA dehydrogenase